MNSITIDIDSSVINVEEHQEGATKGYNPKKVDSFINRNKLTGKWVCLFIIKLKNIFLLKMGTTKRPVAFKN